MESHYEELLHPNNMQEVKDDDSDDDGGCAYYFLKLDAEILRPMLLYKYRREEMQRQDDMHELVRLNHNLLGSAHPGKLDGDSDGKVTNHSVVDLNSHKDTGSHLGRGLMDHQSDNKVHRNTITTEHDFTSNR